MSENEFTKKHHANGIPSQVLLDAGLNVFALDLLIESFTDIAENKMTPLEFKYKGINVSLAVASEKPLDV